MNPALAAARLEQATNRALARLLWRRGWRVRLLAFTSYGGQGWVRVLGRAVLSSAPGAELELGRGWRRFLTVPLAGVAVDVTVGGTTATLRTGPGGYLDSVLAAELPAGWHDLTLSGHHGPAAHGRVRVVGADERVGVVSDIDDTVIVTALPRPLRAFWNTFVQHESSRRPVPGMPELFARLEVGQRPEPFTAYVSTGAWNVAPTLGRFLARHGYPPGPLLMTDWGPGDERWFRSGRQHKHDTLRQLLADLPSLTWTLVGDDGQHDPALYEDLAAEHPHRVSAILIRELTQTEQVRTHGSPTARPGEGAHDTPRRTAVPVLRGPDGRALVAALDRLGKDRVSTRGDG